MSEKVALITGITGQDGSYLAELLLGKGYVVHGIKRRGETFVTRKITRGLAGIAMGLQQDLYLGNLDAKRDWGHARDYVEMQWRMLQQETPQDYVIATGRQISVRDFVIAAAGKLGVTLKWQGEGVDEVGIVESVEPTALTADELQVVVGDTIIRVDPTYYRPAEVETLLGDPSKAHKELGWKPTTTLDEMVEEMVSHDLDQARQQALLRASGFSVNTPQES